jgi:hypothetical protein
LIGNIFFVSPFCFLGSVLEAEIALTDHNENASSIGAPSGKDLHR